jgi:hypothetical protein
MRQTVSNARAHLPRFKAQHSLCGIIRTQPPLQIIAGLMAEDLFFHGIRGAASPIVPVLQAVHVWPLQHHVSDVQ